MSDIRKRAWRFTLNAKDGVLPEKPLEYVPGAMTYVVYQEEVAPTTGTRHFQGFVQFKNPQRFAGVKKHFPSWVNIGVARGTAAQNRVYCTKSDTAVAGSAKEFGTLPAGQGARSDVDQVKSLLDNGTGMLAIADHNFSLYLRHHNAFAAYAALRSAKFGRDFATQCIVYYGPTGSGKSSHCRELAPDAYWLSQGTYGNCWWDGYSGQADVVIDDFYGWLKYSFMLRLLDRNPMVVPCHGGNVNFMARRVFITSNVHPQMWYKRVEHSALMRRMPFIYKIGYSVQFPCVACRTFPHQVDCRVAGSKNLTPSSSASSAQTHATTSWVSSSLIRSSGEAAALSKKRRVFTRPSVSTVSRSHSAACPGFGCDC